MLRRHVDMLRSVCGWQYRGRIEEKKGKVCKEGSGALYIDNGKEPPALVNDLGVTECALRSHAYIAGLTHAGAMGPGGRQSREAAAGG